jgi:putative two-component system response regulator
MKTHTTLGRDAIAKAEALFGIAASFLRFAKEIASPTRKSGTAAAIPWAWPASASPVGAPDGRRRRLRRPDQPAGVQTRPAPR